MFLFLFLFHLYFVCLGLFIKVFIHSLFIYLCAYLFIGGTGNWTQSFTLAKLELYFSSHTPSSFCCGKFGDRFSWTICMDYYQTMILLISASQAVRITGVSHQHLSIFLIFETSSPGWPRTHDPTVFTSHVYPHTQLFLFIFNVTKH
jgi:hypothetical protein